MERAQPSTSKKKNVIDASVFFFCERKKSRWRATTSGADVFFLISFSLSIHHQKTTTDPFQEVAKKKKPTKPVGVSVSDSFFSCFEEKKKQKKQRCRRSSFFFCRQKEREKESPKRLAHRNLKKLKLKQTKKQGGSKSSIVEARRGGGGGDRQRGDRDRGGDRRRDNRPAGGQQASQRGAVF